MAMTHVGSTIVGKMVAAEGAYPFAQKLIGNGTKIKIVGEERRQWTNQAAADGTHSLIFSKSQ